MEKFSVSKLPCVVFVFCAAMAIASSGQTLTTVYSFCSQTNCADGSLPHAGLVQGTDGNLYGTTSQGAAFDGTIFQITPQGAITTLHTFGGTDGANSLAGLLQGADGNFYGTTFNGGANDDPSCVFGGFVGCGTVFKVTPGGSFHTLYNFCSQPYCFDGAEPPSALVQGTDGNLYGTSGGQAGGTFFKITLAGTLTTLYYFCSQPNCADGEYPLTLVQGADGNFYGTTYAGGTSNNCNSDYYPGCGTVFKITPQGTLTTLHSFDNAGGCFPEAGLVQGTDGNFYGTTSEGGIGGYCGNLPVGSGTIFKITPDGTLTTLHFFCSLSNCADGRAPYGELVQATDGNFYGTTNGGGANGDRGTIFRVTPGGFTTLYSFCSQPNCADGILPYGKLMQAADGNFYGTTYEGGTNGAGTVFRLIPLGSSTTAVTSSPNPSTFGEPVTITATVSPSGPPAPTGTVGFTSNGTAISGCTAVTLSAGEAVCMTTGLAVGTDAIVATYSGDSNYAGSSGTLSQLVNPIPSPLQFVAVTPCRLVDTRPDRGGSGPIQGGTSRDFPIPQEGGCNIPTSAAAYSLNVSVVPQGPLGYLTIWPTDEGRPVVATLNSIDGRIKADAAIVPAGTNGAVSIYVTQTTNVILDINGYFAAASGSTLAFYPLTPCRVADTRRTDFPQGLGSPFLPGLHERDFPILNATTCNIPSSAAAYSLNFSVVPHGPLGYMTVWPTGQPRPLVSTLNDIPAQIIANAAIVPAGDSGEVSVYPSNDTDLAIDINGYFAAPGTGGLSLYAVAPCRVFDTRHVGSGQPFSGTLSPPVDVTGSLCGPPATAQAYVFNATVVPTGALGYLTLWPDGQPRPTVSTLNALDGSITNNMAIVPSTNGKVDAYASGLTQLILDISSYFAP